MKNIACLFITVFTLFGTITSWADVRLPAIIGNHMVLQQNSEVKLWGWSEPAEKVTVKTDWDTTTYTTTGSGNAKWNVTIKTPAAGGPHTITIKGNNTIDLEDVLIGEVWVCSGQSNMEMNISWGMTQYAADVAKADNNKSIRFFHVPRITSDYPQDDVEAKWVVCDSASMKRFSAVGYFFGNKIQQELNVPVGLINSSWGGTPAEVWTPKEKIEQDTVLKEAAAKLSPAAWWPVNAGATFNAMIHPLLPYKIAGALWYQGEANVNTWSTYQPLMTTMIDSWRKLFEKDFPFYLVQIAPFAGYGKDNYKSALLREAQTKIATHPNTGMIVVSDLVNDINDIHPKLKKEVGLRLADYALAETYGKSSLLHKSPSYKNMKVTGNKIQVFFDNAPNGLMSKGGAPTEFYIAGEDKNFLSAEAKIQGSSVIVSNKTIKNPVAVRFGFSNAAMPNLFSKEGLPVNLFRTDDWTTDVLATTK